MASSATTPTYNALTEQQVVDAVTALKADIAALQSGAWGAPISATASTLTVTAATHAGKTVLLDRAAGIAVTLPAASGSGAKYRFVIKTTVSSNSTTIKAASASDSFLGTASQAADGGSTSNMWEVAANDDTITFDGSTKGGIAGDVVELEDVASGLFIVRVVGAATGTEATPFSATVS